jgi:Na+/melibiose symporter-like transporter
VHPWRPGEGYLYHLHAALRGTGETPILSLSRDVGQAIGAAAAACIIGLGGYVSGAAAQSDTTVTSIRIAAGAVPAAVSRAAIAVMAAYPLTESKSREIARRHAGHRRDETSPPRRVGHRAATH